MGLFGPLGDIRAGVDDFGGFQGGAGGFLQDGGRPRYPADLDEFRKNALLSVLQAGGTPSAVTNVAPTAGGGAAIPSATAGSPAAASLAPALTTLGGFTTRRTQLFGPLANLFNSGALAP